MSESIACWSAGVSSTISCCHWKRPCNPYVPSGGPIWTGGRPGGGGGPAGGPGGGPDGGPVGGPVKCLTPPSSGFLFFRNDTQE